MTVSIIEYGRGARIVKEINLFCNLLRFQVVTSQQQQTPQQKIVMMPNLPMTSGGGSGGQGDMGMKSIFGNSGQQFSQGE